VVAGTTYQKTRRSVRRRFFFRPSAITNQIILYSLAHAAWKHGVGVHWIAMMSTHDHDGVSDRLGNLPDFLRDYHRDVAMALRRVLGIAETVWSDAPTSAVELLNEAAQCQAAVYAITNPVAAGLVFSAAEWPGLITLRCWDGSECFSGIRSMDHARRRWRRRGIRCWRRVGTRCC